MDRGGGGVVTLFVSNLPTKLHWSGLRQTFGRHGDLVDSFIAKKRDKAGKRFGFVRFATWKDAYRAMERLNGFKLYGYRLTVSVARFNGRTSYWRRTRTNKEKLGEKERDQRDSTNHRTVNQQGGVDAGLQKSESSKGKEENNTRETTNCICVQGHVDEEAIQKLSKSVIGTTTTVCSIETVKGRLDKWGLGDLQVKRIGGQNFLIEFHDVELFQLMETQKWSLLEEVFSEVERWTESYRPSERVTWIDVYGIPLHCWNIETFKSIAGIWGSWIAMGENTSQQLGCDRISMLITTSQTQKIEDLIDLEAGREIFSVRITETGIRWEANHTQKKSLDEFHSRQPASSKSESSSESIATTGEKRDTKSQEEPRNSYQEAFNEMDMGMKSNDYVEGVEKDKDRRIGETDLVGDSSEELVGEAVNGDQVVSSKLNKKRPTKRNEQTKDWASDGSVGTDSDMINPMRARVLEDVGGMGFNKNDLFAYKPTGLVSEVDKDQDNYFMGHKGSWADCVNKLNSPLDKDTTIDKMHREQIEERGFVGEGINSNPKNLSVTKHKNQTRVRRYSSLQDLQDKVLTEEERRK
ncbi:hypothetical protein HRI_002965800 [Hibiscus trionum]|uniref:RRM domain-containing protein n=1 Tax=Hibiscus trionum TaxID=183268 RepID=A0A9W7IEE0_HIBTR|nr:hypothetical protein HRI_002965800 [Hibiscus trionum]